MKQTKILLSVFMAIVMMAMSPTKVWADNVASVTIDGTTTGYDNIQTAVTAAMDADEATMTLLANIDLGGGFITFSKGNVTLDLNSKTLAAHSSYDIFVDGCSLTITDNSEGKTGSVPANASSLYVKSGSITIHAGTFSSQWGACLNIEQNVTAKIDGGRFYTTHEYTSNAIFTSVAALVTGYAYYITGTETQIVPNADGSIPAKDITVKKVEESPAGEDAVSVTINGTTIGYSDFATALTAAEAAEAATIKLLKNVAISFTTFDQGNITLDLNGKIIQNPNGSAMSVQGASLTIIDTSEEQTGTVTFTYQYEGSTISAISGSLTIYAGTFESTKRAALWVGKAYGSDVMPNVKLYGGHFISPTYAIYTEDPNILTSGKAFYDAYDNILTEIAEYGHLLGKDGYSALDVTVKDAPVASVTINGTTTGYNNIQDAFSAALNAESASVKILDDVTLIQSNGSLSVDNGNVTIDLNGHTVSIQFDSVIRLTGGALTIIDSNEDKSGRVTTTVGNTIRATGGSITIKDGTFTSGVGQPLKIDGTASVSLTGGRFISYNNVEAVLSYVGSPLANGYSYYNATTGVKLTATASTSVSENDVIVMKDAMEINGNGAFTCPVNFTPQSVTFNRNITKDGGKYSFIVPFDIPAEQAEGLGQFYTYDKYENDIVYFAEETTGVKANTAYFFNPASTITSISLEDAEIKATTSMADATNPSELGLYGTYKKIAAPVGAYGYASDADAADKF
ncbi:MAG: hypothetical protein MJZ12_06685, partial [Prevotella sp.]|nr:hypothetical protein [Prevotella sp.]